MEKRFFSTKPIRTGAETFITGTASCRIQVQGVDELFEEYKKSCLTQFRYGSSGTVLGPSRISCCR
jgi:hypothetical protein